MLKNFLYILQIIYCFWCLLFPHSDCWAYLLGSMLVLSIISFICIIKTNTPDTKGYYIRPIYIFSLSFIIVHFQTFLDLLVGKNVEDFFGYYSSTELCLRTATIALLGLNFLGISYNIFINNIYKNISKRTAANLKISASYSVCELSYRVSIFMLVAFFILFVAVNGSLYLSGAYSQEMINNMSSTLGAYISILVDALIVICVIFKSIIIYKKHNGCNIREFLKSFGLPFYIVLATYWFFIAMSGDRGPIIFSAMALVAGASYTTKIKPNIITIIFTIVLCSLIISLMGVSRINNGSNDKYSSESIDEYFGVLGDRESVLPLTSELAGSNVCTMFAVDAFPARYSHSYGLFSLYGVLNAIPFWGSISSALGIRSPITSSSQFIDLVLNNGDDTLSGNGSTIIADLYIEGGVIGVIIGMILFGLLFAYIDVFMFSRKWIDNNLLTIIVSFVLLSKAIYIPRSMATAEVRLIVFILILICIILYITSKNMRFRRTRRMV